MSRAVDQTARGRPPRAAHVVNAGNLREYGIVFAFVILFVTLSLSSEFFFSFGNFRNILEQWSATAILAVGFTLVLIAGNFDLSGGAIFSLAGVVAATVVAHMGTPVAMLAGLAVGVGVGLVNGLLITAGRINSFIATLATSVMVGGVALQLTGGGLVTVEEPSFTGLGRGDLLSMPYAVWTFAAFAVVFGFILSSTTFGRMVYAVGGNLEAARRAGIRVRIVCAATFAISGLTSAVGGLIVASRVATGEATAGGFSTVFDAFAGIVIGGTSMLGGVGAMWRTVLGVMLLAMMQNGFNLMGIGPVYQQLFTGVIMLLAVGSDVWTRRAT